MARVTVGGRRGVVIRVAINDLARDTSGQDVSRLAR